MSHITQRLSKFWKSSSMVVLHRLLRISTRSPCSRKSIEGRYRRGGGCRNFVGSLRVLVVPVRVCMCVCVYVCVCVCECVCVAHECDVSESRHTCEWVMSHTWMNHVTLEWVLWHVWMGHVTHVNESRDTYEWVTYLCMCDVTHSCVTWLVHKCGMTHSYMWFKFFTHVAWLIN